MTAIQLPSGIQVLNPEPVDSAYGPYASLATAKAAINIALRYDGMMVKITGDGIYWWQAADLTDAGLLPFVSNGPPLGKYRYVYLFGDAQDASLAGGVANNCYTTFQTAYNAANTIQVALGGTNIVVIQVYCCTAAQVGDLTLSANYNTNVFINGINIATSTLGNIIATNASGNGYTVGTTGVSYCRLSNLKIGNITTNATGTTGNSGNVTFLAANIQVGNIDTSITNASNTTGTGGTFRYNNVVNNYAIIGAITTSAKGTAAAAGLVIITCPSATITSITTSVNNVSGGITVYATSGRIQVTTITYSGNDVTQSSGFTFQNCQVTTANITFGGGGAGMNLVNSDFTTASLLNNGNGTSLLSIIGGNCGQITTNTAVKTTATNVGFTRLINVGTNSKYGNCCVNASTASPAVNGISTGCGFYNCSVLGGTTSLDNGSAVSVLFTSKFSSFENAVGVNVTLT